MDFIEELVYEYVIEFPWCIYWFFVVLGFFFRCGTLKYSFLTDAMIVKKTLASICFVFALTIILSLCRETVGTSLFLSAIGVGMLLYSFYSTLVQKSENGSIDSFLVLVNSIFVTALSYVSFPASLGIAIVIVWISFKIKKHFEFEEQSEFWEIVWLSIESVVLSMLVWWNHWDSLLQTFLLVLFTQTALVLLNVIVTYTIRCVFEENAEGYLHRVLGMDNL